MIKFLPWIAVIIISTGYIAQIAKIHMHREVRDLSAWSYLFWGVAYLILAYQGYAIDAPVFIFKNVVTFLLVGIILSQIYIHHSDEWHDDEDKSCNNCSNELEPLWKHCPDCGQTTIQTTTQTTQTT